jgi:hypothetical protein
LGSEALDVLRFLFVQVDKIGLSFAIYAQKLIELSMDRLGVAMLGTLNDERHKPSCQRRNSVPVECVSSKEQPQSGIAENNQKRARVGGQDTQVGKPFSNRWYIHLVR